MEERARKAVVIGLSILTFLAPLKFTQPVILYYLEGHPKDLMEWILTSWPGYLFYAILIPLVVIRFLTARWGGLRREVWILPVAFLLTQCVATISSVNPLLSGIVLAHFAALAASFLLGALFVREEYDLRWLMAGWFFASLWVALDGISQAAGGLQEMRDYLYAHPELAQGRPEIWHKVTSSRIFSTFVNANALGDYIVPAVFMVSALGYLLWKKFHNPALILPFGALIAALLYCLWKTVSKSSYGILFISAALGVVLLIRNRKMAWGIVAALLVLSAAIFAVGYGQAAVDKAKTTGSARLDYWRAAWKVGCDYPVLGTGPGTFGKMYVKYKRPQDEETKLVHNNYLQMWCDSGFPGFIAFALWLPGTLWLWVRRWRGVYGDERIIPTLAWCACVAFALHSLVDFELYMVSNAWPVFVVLGWLAASKPVGRRQGLQTG